MHFLYQYSLDFLLDMFTTALETPDLQGDYTQRLAMITATLFKVSREWVLDAPGLKYVGMR